MADTLAIPAPTKMGRPTIYSDELRDRLCRTIASGVTLREVCREDWAPSHETLYVWGRERPDFSDALAHARKASASILADSCLGIADAVDTDSEFGSARVSKAREQVGVRRWLAGCLDRDTYGERPPVVAVQVTPVVAVAFGRLGGAAAGE